ncbi:MAG: prepilin-type N-terminal cleavage/methylation domain-containing protein [Candidatus Wallbacteria bacterium]|nr:prepilin-type N-terminal cleavage/methylation domain-containing protein [Candidatus Wallbacteria bacterium]
MSARPCYRWAKGFSLVEMLVVVAILSLLVGGAYQIYTSSTTDTRYQAMRANLKMMKTAIDQFHAKTGAYPTSLEALTRSYLSRVPDDPTTERIGNDWMVIGPNDDPNDSSKWVSATAGPPTGGIADVRSASDFEK